MWPKRLLWHRRSVLACSYCDINFFTSVATHDLIGIFILLCVHSSNELCVQCSGLSGTD